MNDNIDELNNFCNKSKFNVDDKEEFDTMIIDNITEILNRIIYKKIDIDIIKIINSQYYNPTNINKLTMILHTALIDKPEEILIKTLLEKGIDIESIYENLTPLQTAIKNNNSNEKIIKLLIDNNAKIDVMDVDKSLLHLAINNPHFEIIRILLDNGIDPNIKNKNGDTILHLLIEAQSKLKISPEEITSINNKIQSLLDPKYKTDILIVNNKKEQIIELATQNMVSSSIFELFFSKPIFSKEILMNLKKKSFRNKNPEITKIIQNQIDQIEK